MSLDLHPRFMPYASILVGWLKQQDPRFTVTSARRSTKAQEDLYRRFLAGKHPYTVAPPGCSKHQLGLAFDIARSTDPAVNLRDPLLHQLGRYWRSLGGEWGGEADPIHFGLPGRLC